MYLLSDNVVYTFFLTYKDDYKCLPLPLKESVKSFTKLININKNTHDVSFTSFSLTIIPTQLHARSFLSPTTTRDEANTMSQ